MSSILVRRANMVAGGVTPRLPAGYTELAYLEGTGTQYIDTGIECTSDLKVQFEGLATTNVNAAASGGIHATSPYFRHHWSPYNSQFYWIQKDTASTSSVALSASVNTWYNVTIDPTNGTALINGTEKTFTALASSYTTGKSYCVFARMANNGSTQSRPSKFKFFKMWRGGLLLRDLVPAMRDSDSVVGMYDLVSNTFLTNAGSGTFNYGTL